ncbi:hypothetical protein ACC691_40560, partial [Rhizobium johnstonii]|uniref:hypothetical protein n=1 Tax=Rhizobium johnstonii TaxID=3019933 RepID=UPI003F994A30
PTQSGTFTVGVTATNADGGAVEKSLDLVVAPAAAWTGPTSLTVTTGVPVTLPLASLTDGQVSSVQSSDMGMVGWVFDLSAG